jgi:hypothetical protein
MHDPRSSLERLHGQLKDQQTHCQLQLYDVVLTVKLIRLLQQHRDHPLALAAFSDVYAVLSQLEKKNDGC